MTDRLLLNHDNLGMVTMSMTRDLMKLEGQNHRRHEVRWGECERWACRTEADLMTGKDLMKACQDRQPCWDSSANSLLCDRRSAQVLAEAAALLRSGHRQNFFVSRGWSFWGSPGEPNEAWRENRGRRNGLEALGRPFEPHHRL